MQTARRQFLKFIKNSGKTLKGYEKYQVSSEGRVRIAATLQTILPKCHNVGGKFRSGMYVTLLRNGKPFRKFVKHLVIEAFGGVKIDDKIYVVNSNGTTEDCRLVNLEIKSVLDR
jgi:hypothetical protein